MKTKLLTLFFWLTYSVMMSAQTFEIDGLKYEVTSSDNHEVAVKGGEAKAELIIPDKVNYEGIEYTVTCIGSWAFYGHSNLSSVTLPKGLKVIDGMAFSDCTSLSTITLPEGLTSIEAAAFEGCKALSSVNLPDNLTNIGTAAFRYCMSLPSITLPKNLTSIEEQTFEFCISLTSISLPSNVTSIGRQAFSECASISTITLPEKLTSIGVSAFNGCTSLTSITLPNNLTNIGSYAFGYCTSLKSINVSSNNSTFSSIDGVLFSKDGTSLICFPGGKQAISYIVPNNVTNINDYAFENYSVLSSVTISEGVMNISNTAFCKCASLESINVSSDNSYFSSIDGVLFSKDGTSLIHFPEGKQATSYIVPDNVTNINDYAFNYNSSLSFIAIPEGVTNIGNWAFANCSSLSSITLPESLTNIGSGAFETCNSLSSIFINAVTPPTASSLRLNGESIPIYVPDESVEAYKAADGWKEHDIQAQSSANNFEVDGIWYEVTSSTTHEVTVTGGDDKAQIIIPDKVNHVGIAYTVTGIGQAAFKECSSLASITLPKGVTNVTYNAFEGCSALKSFNVASDNPTFSTIDGILFSKDGTSLIYFPEGRQATSYIVPDHVTNIGPHAFYNNPTLSSITIQEGVTSIGQSAFWKCSSLSSITLPASLTEIGAMAVNQCTVLSSIFINALTPPTVTGYLLGLGGTKNTTLYVPKESVEAYSTAKGWKDFTVLEQPSVKEFEIDGIKYKVTSSDTHEVAVTGGDDKTQIVIPDKVNYAGIDYTVTSIEEAAFWECTLLSSITLPKGVTNIGSHAFYQCTSLSSITLPKGVTNIGSYAFYQCTSLSSIIIPEGVTSIGEYTFQGCTSLTSITLPKGMTSIGNVAFQYCTALSSITLPEELTSIGNYAFVNTALTSITLPNKVTNIGAGAFLNLKLESINVNSDNPTFSSIDGILFSKDETTLIYFPGGKQATSYIVPGHVTNIDSWAFSYNSTLTSITIPEGVTNIKNNAFAESTLLSTITLPESLTSIGNLAFQGCTSLTSINLPKGLTDIGNHIFTKTSLSSIFINAAIPPTIQFADLGLEDNIISIYVPEESVESYKAAEGWNAHNILSQSFETEGIKYKITSSTTHEVAVTRGDDKAQIVIPNKVNYEGIAYTVTGIGQDAFEGCNSLSSITLPETLTSIGSNAFSGCNALSSIFINAVTPPTAADSELGLGGNKSISLYVPDESVDAYSTAHGWNEFTVLSRSAKQFEIDGIKYKITSSDTHEVAVTGGDDKTQIVIPNKVNYAGIEYTVTSIEYWAFSNCRLLSSISLPQGLRSIGNYAFSYSPYLSSIYLPATVTEIGTGVFNGCSSLESINVASSNQNYLSIDGVLFTKDKKSLICFPERKYAQSYIVPDEVTHINDGAFSDCTSLSAITLPEGLTNIGTNAFKNCAALSSIVSNAVTPPTIKDNSTFTGVDKNIPVYVPNGTVTAYKRATGWKEFTNYQSQATSVRQTELPNGLKMSNGKLDNADGLSIEIFDANGRLVYTGSDTTVSLPSGVYIVRHASSCFKIRF